MEPTNDPNAEVDVDGDAAVQSESFERVTAGTGFTNSEGEKDKVEASVNLFVGSDLTEAVERYGEDVVYERYRRGVTKDCGNAIRSKLNQLLEDDDVAIDSVAALAEEELADWRPDVTRRRVAKSAEEDILSKFEGLDEEKKAAILAALQNQAAG